MNIEFNMDVKKGKTSALEHNFAEPIPWNDELNITFKISYDALEASLSTYDRIYPQIELYDGKQLSLFKYGNFKDFLPRGVYNKDIAFHLNLKWFSNKLKKITSICLRSRGMAERDTNLYCSLGFCKNKDLPKTQSPSIDFKSDNIFKNVFKNKYFKAHITSPINLLKYEIYKNNHLIKTDNFNPIRKDVWVKGEFFPGQYELRIHSESKTFKYYFIILDEEYKNIKCLSKFGISDYAATFYNKNLNIKNHRKMIDLSAYKEDLSFGGKYNPSLVDKDMLNNNFIFCFKKMPIWLSKNKSKNNFHKYGPYDYDKYKSLINSIFKTINSNGIKGKVYIEVWNESSIGYEYADDLETLKAMTDMQIECAKKFNFSIVGLNTHTFPTDHSNYISNYIHLFKDQLNLLEFISVHLYTYDPQNMEKHFEDIIDICKKYNLKLLITEFGFRYPHYSHYEQCYYTFKLFLLVIRNYNYIENFLLFRTKSTLSLDDDSYDQNCSEGYSMVKSNGFANKLFYLIVKINNYFSGVDFIKYQDLDSFKLYEFKKANEKKSFIVESNFGAINIDTPKHMSNFLGLKDYEMFDMFYDRIASINNENIIIINEK